MKLSFFNDRIKRTAPTHDALRSFGHALRVRRFDDDAQKFNDATYELENANENQVAIPSNDEIQQILIVVNEDFKMFMKQIT